MNTPMTDHARTFRPGQVLAVVATLGLAVALTACGPQNSIAPGANGTPGTPATTPASTSAAPSPSTSAPSATSSAAPSPSTSTPSATAGATPSSPAIATPADTPLCTAASLAGALDSNGGGAAGSVYLNLVLSNSTSSDCILDGYPGVSLVKAGSTEPIGAPADRNVNAPSNGPITLVPGASASAVLQYTQADNYQDCQREQADAVLVYPPEATDHLEIAHSLTACSNAQIKLLTISAFAP